MKRKIRIIRELNEINKTSNLFDSIKQKKVEYLKDIENFIDILEAYEVDSAPFFDSIKRIKDNIIKRKKSELKVRQEKLENELKNILK